MRTGEDDRADVRIAVCTIDQLFQLLGDLGIEQRMRASVDTSDKHPGVALDGNVSWGLRATSRRVHVVLRELAVVASPVSGARGAGHRPPESATHSVRRGRAGKCG